MTQSWQHALHKYRYTVHLKDFRSAISFPEFFTQSISGDRDSTMQFEAYFQSNAEKIEPWFEVVFWKLYSQPQRSQQKTEDIIQQLTVVKNIKPRELLEKANNFMNSESIEDFNAFRKMFGFKTNVIAIVATFPAFLRPHQFPMVDTRVAKWVNQHYKLFNSKNPDAPTLIPSEYSNSNNTTVLNMNDFSFYIHWIHWTRHMAEKLSLSTGSQWRPRDVEMAIFTAWGGRGDKHPAIQLKPFIKN